MIDFYSKNKYDVSKAKYLMQNIFCLDEEKIFVCQLCELSEILIDDDIECLCVISDVCGSVKSLLQIYRAEIYLSVFLDKLKHFSEYHNDTFFVPYDDFNGYYKISGNSEIQEVSLNEEKSNDDKIVF